MDEDAEARFGEFVAARGTALYRIAYLLTGNHQDAEDLVLWALARLAARWTRLSDPSRAEAYVRRTIYHHQVSRWRLRSWRREAVTDALPEPPAADDPNVRTGRALAGHSGLHPAIASRAGNDWYDTEHFVKTVGGDFLDVVDLSGNVVHTLRKPSNGPISLSRATGYPRGG